MSTAATAPRELPPGVYTDSRRRLRPYRAVVRVKGVQYAAGYHPTPSAAEAARRERLAVVVAALRADRPVPPYREPRPPAGKMAAPAKAEARNPRCRPHEATGDDLRALRRYAALRDGDRRGPDFGRAMAAVVALCRRHEAVMADGVKYELDCVGELHATPYSPHAAAFATWLH